MFADINCAGVNLGEFFSNTNSSIEISPNMSGISLHKSSVRVSKSPSIGNANFWEILLGRNSSL